jgi:hypothetical protein
MGPAGKSQNLFGLILARTAIDDDRLQAAARPQFFQQFVDVILDCRLADSQQSGYFFVAFSLCQVTKDFSLPWSQLAQHTIPPDHFACAFT